jgi:hypothetical protein
MTKWNIPVDDTSISNTSFKLLTVSIPALFQLWNPL